MEPLPEETEYSHADEGPKYAPVSLSKFAILNLVTFGIYSIPWSYRCWRYVRDRDGSDIWPFWRALFNPITYFLLLRDMRENTEYEIPGLFALGYFLVESLWRLPDPYWLASSLAFVMLLPAVLSINELNRGVKPRPAHSKWRARNIPIVLVGGYLLTVIAGSATGVLPSVRVVQGDEMKESDLTYLEESGLVEEGEEILYFYSTGIFSIKGEGNILTNQRVVSYWTDPITYEPTSASAPFAEVANVEVNWGGGFADTVVRVTLVDDSWFMLVLSSEEGGDQEFLDEFERRREVAGSASGEGVASTG